MRRRTTLLLLLAQLTLWGSLPQAHAVHTLLDLCRLSLGRATTQNTSQVADLYQEAELAKPTFDRAMSEAAQAAGATFEAGTLKQPERVQAKATGRQNGETARVLDIVRGAIIAETMQGVHDALAAVQEVGGHYGFEIERTADYFATPKDNGYRGIKLNIRVPYFGESRGGISGYRGTHVTELQIHHRQLYEIKKGKADPLYREIRAIEEANPDRSKLNAGELSHLKELKHRHWLLYELAWQEIESKENLLTP